MSTNAPRPVLMLGGYGSLGSRTSRLLRQLHPELPITIAGRDIGKATAFADALGHATAARVDLDRADLGLPADADPGIVVTVLRDLSLNTMRYAQAQQIPYVALSDGAFEIGPLVARHIHNPSVPVLLLGHSIGSVPALASLYFTREFKATETIEISLVFDPDDPLGPASAADMERIAKIGSSTLLLDGGRWRWVHAEEARRTFIGIGGMPLAGEAVGLVDVLTLAATEARSVRVDIAVGQTETRRRGEAPSHEVIIEITGERRDGASGRFRYELIDREGYAMMSARGVVAAIERLLGLAGGEAPGPGLYLPEVLIDPGHLVRRIEDSGVEIRRM